MVRVLSLTALLALLSITAPVADAASKPHSLSLTDANAIAPAANVSGSEKPREGLSSLPADAQGPISAALGKDDSSYWVHAGGDGFHAENRQHALAMNFTQEGVQVHSHGVGWRLATWAYGYGDALHAVSASAPQTNANRVEYRRGSLTEWYANGPLGLEQGFTFATPPGKANGQPLTVELAFTGDLLATLKPDRTTLTLSRKDGRPTLHYTGLTARDAAGRELRSWLEVKSDRLLLRVNDSGARYPLVIDPYFQLAELTSSDGAYSDSFGYSVALSGSTAVVGAPNHTVGSNPAQGAAYVFVQSGNTWSQQAELTASDGYQLDQFGSAGIAVNSATVVVGVPNHNQHQGATYVFVQNGSTWSQQAELLGSDSDIGDEFGYSVAMSGTTLLVGAPDKVVGARVGVGYVFVQNENTWSQQAELIPPDNGGAMGSSVALSGNTALLGAPQRTIDSGLYRPGGVYVFVQNNGMWSYVTGILSSDWTNGDQFGYSVALSGNTTVIGAPRQGNGTAYVFVGSGSQWSQQAELTASDEAAEDGFGSQVGISGSTLVVGAPGHTVGSNPGQGAAYVFVQSGSTWSQQAELTASDGAPDDELGQSVSVSGSTVLAGAPLHTVDSNQYQGAAYVFVLATVYSPPPGSTLTSNAATFQWSAPPGATAYWLDVGSSPGGSDYANSGVLGGATLAYTVNSLPTDGSTVWVTWYYDINGTWGDAEYSYTAFNAGAAKGVMLLPPPGSTLPGSSVTFTWAAGSGATAYALDAGSSPGGNQYYQSGNLGNVLSATASGLPTDGSAVYVTLWSLVLGQWTYNEYAYTAYSIGGAQGVLNTPAPGATFTGSTVTFVWTAGSGATAYWLDVGSTVGGNQHYQSGNLGNVLTTTVNGLPTNGSTVYATLWSLVLGQWVYNEYTYTAFNAASSIGVMQTPAPGSTLNGNVATFIWSAGSGASAYWVDVGSSAGGNNYYQSGNLGNVLTTTVYSLPANGSQIYLTLWSYTGGQWFYNEYTYTSGP
jgi:hypothetical protein